MPSDPFDAHLTRTAVLLSHLAYEEFTLATERRIRKATGASAVNFIVNGPSHAVVVERGPDIFIVFRGTGIRDKISLKRYVEIWFQLQPEGPGRVHDRYVRALDRIWEFGVKPALNAVNNDKRVVFCGHSLGGAVAVLAAGRFLTGLEDESAPGVRVLTFGCPRVGDKAYAKAFPVPVDRWVFGNDFIQWIPPGWPFWHFGAKHHLVNGGIRHPKSVTAEFLSSVRALKFRRRQLFRRMMLDHHSWNYVKAVGAWADKVIRDEAANDPRDLLSQV